MLRGQFGKLDVTEGRHQVMVNVAGVAGIGRRPNSWTGRVFQPADQELGDFPIFTFGTRPNAFGGWIITEVDEPVYLPGHISHYVKVMPGDFIFGDNDGVQLIPAQFVDEVLLRVEETFEKENAEREQIAAGMSVDEVYRVFGVL